jgi:hypothetical protein
MVMTQNIIKLAVGVDSIDDLYLWQKTRLFDYHGRKATIGWTRRRPVQHEDVCAKGSMYWVIKNHIMVRQRIVGFEPDKDEEVPSWLIILDPELVRTVAVPRKAFQGWRYLAGDQVPPDRGRFVFGERDEEASPEMERDLIGLGLL